MCCDPNRSRANRVLAAGVFAGLQVRIQHQSGAVNGTSGAAPPVIPPDNGAAAATKAAASSANHPSVAAAFAAATAAVNAVAAVNRIAAADVDATLGAPPDVAAALAAATAAFSDIAAATKRDTSKAAALSAAPPATPSAVADATAAATIAAVDADNCKAATTAAASTDSPPPISSPGNAAGKQATLFAAPPSAANAGIATSADGKAAVERAVPATVPAAADTCAAHGGSRGGGIPAATTSAVDGVIPHSPTEGATGDKCESRNSEAPAVAVAANSPEAVDLPPGPSAAAEGGCGSGGKPVQPSYGTRPRSTPSPRDLCCRPRSELPSVPVTRRNDTLYSHPKDNAEVIPDAQPLSSFPSLPPLHNWWKLCGV